MDILVVDGGGTSTKFALFRNGERIKEISLPSCHIMQVGEEKMVEILKYGIQKIKDNDDTVLIFGLAGYGNDLSLRERIKNAINKNFGEYKYYLTNDIELAYYGELGDKSGILLILGTGSIAYKYKDGEFFRSGGWGYFIGDEASGYYLGKKLLRAFANQADGRAEKTKLYDNVNSYFKLKNDYDIISISKNMSRTEIASLAEIVVDLYKCKDPSAIKIIDDMVNQCVIMIRPLLDKDIKEVVLFGGLTKADISLDSLISEKLKEDIVVKISSHDALFGGYKLGINKFNKDYSKKHR